MRKAVFFDIDGTLWDEKMQIPQSTKEALKRLRENGHYAFLCSGRSRSNIRSPRLLELGFDGVVAACGTHIDFHKETIFEKLLSKKQVAHILNVLDEHGILAVLEGPQYIYVDEDSFEDDPYVIYLRRELGEFLKPIHGNNEIVINKLSIAAKKEMMEQLLLELGEEFTGIYHEEEVVEIIPSGYSKATGIEKVCEILDIPLENTYAFGDSANDLEMLRYVAHGIAMGNGTKEAKESAGYITDALWEDGIQNGLAHYGLI